MKKLLTIAIASMFALTACPSEPDARDVLRNNGDSICKAYTDRDDC